ncbi:MAG: DEAD/DEAH box helicase, partial [Candidatus Baltobacteraceae bacterium]
MTTTLEAPISKLSDALVRNLPGSSRTLAAVVERLRSGRGAFALHETIAAARPAVLASLYRALGDQMLIVVPTADIAERTFTDLLYYLGEREPETVALLRSRDESIGAIESPSERSARMTLFADLADRRSRIVIAPVGALRQYVMPRSHFETSRFELRTGSEGGWDATQERLYRLGYSRTDVVSAAGEYAVRGGILDVFAASAAAPARVEFFGDAVESIRPFNLESQRSEGSLESLSIVPWNEIPREEAFRARVIERYNGPASAMSALRSYLAGGADVPEAWLSFAYDERVSVLDYFDERAIVVLEEPAMLATIERALEDERSREEHVLLAGVDSGELSIDDNEVGEALLAEVVAPYPRLDSLQAALAARNALVLPGSIEGRIPDWLPRIIEDFVLETTPAEHFNRQIEMFVQSVRGWVAAGETVILVSSGASRTTDLLRAAGLSVERTAPHLLHLRSVDSGKLQGRVYVDQGNIEAGFSLPHLHLRVLGDREIYGQPPKRVKIRAVKEGVPVTLADLRVADYVVHAVHGIGQYLGLRTEKILGVTQDYLDLKYAGTDRMLVPVTQMHQVGKYGASEGGTPRLSKMGGADWVRTKSRVSESLAKIADGLVALYAEREMARGHAYGPDTPWQAELEEAFPYDETPDQLKAIDDTKADMERERPMDRLVCGDVGYGKTEVAIRAAFKAVADKKQVAILVPTTLLASQHYHNFTSRFAGFPMRIEELSRFKTKKEQQAALAGLAQGQVDIIVGTHRLLQKDVTFADLGLIIVDEEQRFGVMHKER